MRPPSRAPRQGHRLRLLSRRSAILSASDDNTLKLWDVPQGSARQLTLPGHSPPGHRLRLLPDGETIVSVGDLSLTAESEELSLAHPRP